VAVAYTVRTDSMLSLSTVLSLWPGPGVQDGASGGESGRNPRPLPGGGGGGRPDLPALTPPREEGGGAAGPPFILSEGLGVLRPARPPTQPLSHKKRLTRNSPYVGPVRDTTAAVKGGEPCGGEGVGEGGVGPRLFPDRRGAGRGESGA